MASANQMARPPSGDLIAMLETPPETELDGENEHDDDESARLPRPSIDVADRPSFGDPFSGPPAEGGSTTGPLSSSGSGSDSGPLSPGSGKSGSEPATRLPSPQQDAGGAAHDRADRASSWPSASSRPPASALVTAGTSGGGDTPPPVPCLSPPPAPKRTFSRPHVVTHKGGQGAGAPLAAKPSEGTPAADLGIALRDEYGDLEEYGGALDSSPLAEDDGEVMSPRLVSSKLLSSSSSKKSARATPTKNVDIPLSGSDGRDSRTCQDTLEDEAESPRAPKSRLLGARMGSKLNAAEGSAWRLAVSPEEPCETTPLSTPPQLHSPSGEVFPPPSELTPGRRSPASRNRGSGGAGAWRQRRSNAERSGGSGSRSGSGTRSNRRVRDLRSRDSDDEESSVDNDSVGYAAALHAAAGSEEPSPRGLDGTTDDGFESSSVADSDTSRQQQRARAAAPGALAAAAPPVDDNDKIRAMLDSIAAYRPPTAWQSVTVRPDGQIQIDFSDEPPASDKEAAAPAAAAALGGGAGQAAAISPLPAAPAAASSSAEPNGRLASSPRVTTRHTPACRTSLTEQLLVLPNRRRLGIAEYGAPGATARLNVFVYAPLEGVRLFGSWFHAAAARRGVRVVCVDRPGFGLSTALPPEERSYLNYAEDVAAVADALGIVRFGVIGHSAGGLYAAATAVKLPRRVQAVALLAPWAPLATRGFSPWLKAAAHVHFLFPCAARLMMYESQEMARAESQALVRARAARSRDAQRRAALASLNAEAMDKSGGGSDGRDGMTSAADDGAAETNPVVDVGAASDRENANQHNTSGVRSISYVVADGFASLVDCIFRHLCCCCLIERYLSERELEAMDTENFRETQVELSKELWRQGPAAVVQELEMCAKPGGELAVMGFSYRDLPRDIPAHVFVASRDEMTPVRVGEHVGAAIGDHCRISRFDDASHAFWAVPDRIELVMDSMVEMMTG